MRKIKTHLNKFGLIAAAMGMAFGHTASEFISTLVSVLAMPVISFAIGIENWQNHVFLVGTIEIKWGELLKDAIRLILIAFSVVYILHWLASEDQE
jgi:large-conductance mechanosensitive channel